MPAPGTSVSGSVTQDRRCHQVAAVLFLPQAAAAVAQRQNLPLRLAGAGGAQGVTGLRHQ